MTSYPAMGLDTIRRTDISIGLYTLDRKSKEGKGEKGGLGWRGTLINLRRQAVGIQNG